MNGYVRIVAVLAIAGATMAAAPTCELAIDFDNLRSARGDLLVCVTASEKYFPDCTDDPNKRFVTVPARDPHLVLTGLKEGRYAISVHHDENRNAKLDTFAGIPKEGFGFSRNPKIGFGPPKFVKVAIAIGPGRTSQSVKMIYFL